MTIAVCDLSATTQWQALFPAAIVDVIEGYLGYGAEMIRSEILVAPAGCSAQSIPRDHNLGPQKCMCVAVSLRYAVGTRFCAGSHQWDEDADDDCHDRSVTASSGNYLIYDTYVLHAGAANHTDHDKTLRIFFVLRAPDWREGQPDQGLGFNQKRVGKSCPGEALDDSSLR